MLLQDLPSLTALTLLLGTQTAIGFFGTLHHLRPEIAVRCVYTYVRMPRAGLYELITVAVEKRTLQHWAVFELSRATRDYDTVSKTEEVHVVGSYKVQVISDAVLVWHDEQKVDGQMFRDTQRFAILPGDIRFPEPEPDLGPQTGHVTFSWG